MSRSRYTLSGPWAHHDTMQSPGGDIVLEVTDLIDTHGNTFSEGAWRVTFDGRHKRFRGETARNDAARYANDLYWSARLAARG